MQWLKLLGDLSPAALLIVAIWIIAVKVIIPLMGSHKEAIERLTDAQEKSAETMRKSLDANTDAVKESVEHNEKIIKNHLSGQVKRDRVILAEMRSVAEAVATMNNRRRSTDIDSQDKKD